MKQLELDITKRNNRDYISRRAFQLEPMTIEEFQAAFEAVKNTSYQPQQIIVHHTEVQFFGTEVQFFGGK